MGQRKQIALIFSYNENWIGGTYYILNLIHSLNHLSDSQKPIITICSEKEKDFEYVKSETNYEFLNYFKVQNRPPELPIWKKTINFIGYKIFKKPLFRNSDVNYLEDNFQIVFPNPLEKVYNEISPTNKVFWIPDFQEDALPEYFTEDEFLNRKQSQLYIAVKARKVVFSSKHAMKDFHRLYPFAKCETKILNFAVHHPKLQNLNVENIKAGYGISGKYFISPNQFWAHKNHMCVVDAVKELKREGLSLKVIFTGKEYDYRQPQYTASLKDYVKKHNLEENILFLGFIDRKEQLILMENAQAIIQPSFFEGWSTVVEDAKALKKLVIASDIEVHREQLAEQGIFFDPDDYKMLSKLLAELYPSEMQQREFNYMIAQKAFAKEFMSLNT